MDALDDAIGEIEQARDAIESPENRTKLDSIAASLVEMTDTEAGKLTNGEEAFSDVEFPGAAPSPDNLAALEGELADLAEITTGEARGHLEAARQWVAEHRLQGGNGAGSQ